MKLGYACADLDFRDEIRSFFRENLPSELAETEARYSHLRRSETAEWQKLLAVRGWAVPNWPKECGGPGWSPVRRHIWDIEYARANAPEFSIIGVGMVGPLLCRFGNDEQKVRFTRSIIEGDLHFCQGFSEPAAGSDLANLKTRAVRDGDDYVVTGQKTWTSHAADADYMICLARTDFEVKPQAGLSMLLIPMNAAGVTVRPIASIDGIDSINEVFLDEVRVPATDLLGEVHKGWTYAKYLLNTERTHNAYIGMLHRYLDRLRTYDDRSASFRRRIALLEIDIDAHEWSVLRVHAAENEARAGAAASALKVTASVLLLRAADLELEVFGLDGIVESTRATESIPSWLAGEARGKMSQFMYWRAASIFGGTNEVQRTIIWATLAR
jgi:alkylation response protein AidB-like acyl-CoA dehydrogenase